MGGSLLRHARISATRTLTVALGVFTFGCGSDDGERALGAPAAGSGQSSADPGAPESAMTDPATMGSATEPEATGSGESILGAGDSTPLDPGAPAEEASPEGAEPPLTPPAELELVELVIPEDLPGCASPFPHDPAVDEATGKVYYAGSSESCIGEYDPESGEFRAWPTATPDSYPHGLVVVDGLIYFTGIDEDLIGRIDPATGEAIDFPVDATRPHTPVLHAGAIWFTAQGGGQFGRLDPASGAAEVVALSSPNTGPYGIWPAPDGSLWMALFGTNRLARIDTAAAPPSADEIVLPEASSRPRRIAVDASGEVWFTDYARRALGAYDPSSPEGERVREFPTPGGGRPYGIAIGPDGRVWYNDQDAAEIVGFDQATSSVVARLPLELESPGPVRNIAVDQPRRRLWLAISDVGRLAMIQF